MYVRKSSLGSLGVRSWGHAGDTILILSDNNMGPTRCTACCTSHTQRMHHKLRWEPPTQSVVAEGQGKQLALLDVAHVAENRHLDGEFHALPQLWILSSLKLEARIDEDFFA